MFDFSVPAKKNSPAESMAMDETAPSTFCTEGQALVVRKRHTHRRQSHEDLALVVAVA